MHVSHRRFYPDGQVLSLLANEELSPSEVIPILKPTLRMKVGPPFFSCPTHNRAQHSRRASSSAPGTSTVQSCTSTSCCPKSRPPRKHATRSRWSSTCARARSAAGTGWIFATTIRCTSPAERRRRSRSRTRGRSGSQRCGRTCRCRGGCGVCLHVWDSRWVRPRCKLVTYNRWGAQGWITLWMFCGPCKQQYSLRREYVRERISTWNGLITRALRRITQVESTSRDTRMCDE